MLPSNSQPSSRFQKAVTVKDNWFGDEQMSYSAHHINDGTLPTIPTVKQRFFLHYEKNWK